MNPAGVSPQALERGQGEMRIRVKPDSFGNFEVVEVINEEGIEEELKRRGVYAPTHFLSAWLARLRGEATAPELKLLEDYCEAREFLESITEEVEP